MFLITQDDHLVDALILGQEAAVHGERGAILANAAGFDVETVNSRESFVEISAH